MNAVVVQNSLATLTEGHEGRFGVYLDKLAVNLGGCHEWI